jgi:nicotinamidase-related amidase
MSPDSQNLHGSAPDKSKTALLVIDVINDFDFDEADQLLQLAKPMAEQLSNLISRARQTRMPVIYVNDNFGRWRSDFRAQVEHCLRGSRGSEIVAMLQPQKDDYFVLKPKHSGFFATTLDTLLNYLEVEALILTGIATNICVLFTANDAYMRDLRLIVPADCVAANSQELTDYALTQMETVLKANIVAAAQLTTKKLEEWIS